MAALKETATYEDLKASDEAHQMHGFGHPLMQKGPRQLVVFESGDGAMLKDVIGKEYLDAMAGITVAHLGHARKDLAQVAFEQRNLTKNNAIKVCERLSGLAAQAFPENMTGSRVYLTAGGGEGIEAAYHLALRNSFFRNYYPGSTFIPASMQPELSDYGWKRWMEGHDKSVYASNSHRMFSNIDPPHELFMDKSKMKEGENLGQAAARQLEKGILQENPETVAAFVFEPVQGDGGAVDMHRDFFPLAQKICKKHGVLMIADEIMAFAKTGHWAGMELYGVCPDILVISKGLTSGYLPMGAVIYTNDIWKTAFNNPSTKLMMSDVWQHDYTWSGHPVCAVVALKNLDRIENEGLIMKCAGRGRTFLEVLKKKLEGLHVVQQVRGTGVMLGVDLISVIATDIEQKVLLEYGVILRANTNKHCLLLTPPYVMTDEQFERVADALYKVLSSWATLAESAISKSRQH
ncbi:PLP-dependent transferase [Delitschia confertaspora ATCC 74209]|uniref:PLP-dependent transferase n=1 Tax=Delitschia confertaspora ATCC 74209 TaxID=1513339 RepID=A0A9P4MP63_9PLEO|nr:PLP-dependent transferase [Delitschia confertaspora ATCC 74209]